MPITCNCEKDSDGKIVRVCRAHGELIDKMTVGLRHTAAECESKYFECRQQIEEMEELKRKMK